MSIVMVGSTGLVGGRVISLLKERWDVREVNDTEGVDITEKEVLVATLDTIKPDVIMHFAAKTNVDACEADKEQDLKMLRTLHVVRNGDLRVDLLPNAWGVQGSAFGVNVVGTKHLVDYAKKNNCGMIYISTDFVFDGKKDYYSEEDIPFPLNWYGMTKYWGEKVVEGSLDDFLIVRIAYPFGVKSSVRADFVWRIIELLSAKEKVCLVSDHVMTPTFIDDIAFGLEFLLRKKAHGIYHLVGDSFVSPYEAGVLIAKIFSYNNILPASQVGGVSFGYPKKDVFSASIPISSGSIHPRSCELNTERGFLEASNKTIITKTTRADFFRGRAMRPFQLRLQNDKLARLGFQTKSFEEAVNIMRSSI